MKKKIVKKTRSVLHLEGTTTGKTKIVDRKAETFQDVVTRFTPPVGFADIKVSVSYPDGNDVQYNYVIPNVHHNIPKAKLVRMDKVILQGLQSEYGMGVRVK